MQVALAARDVGEARSAVQGNRRARLRLRRVDARRTCSGCSRSSTRTIGEPDVVVYNASGRVRGPFVDLDPAAGERAIEVTAYGGFLVARKPRAGWCPKNHGAILFTGASASVKGYPQSAPFAMGKFALRGLAQSMARELAAAGHPRRALRDRRRHRAPGRTPPSDAPDALLDPDAIAVNYLHVLRQPRSAWTWEIELRPWVEKF